MTIMAAERDIDTGTDQLLCSIRHGVATLTLNRPEARNALSAQLSPALGRMIVRCGADDTVRALLITGAGTAFCAGGDVKNMGDRRVATDQSPDERFRIMQQRPFGLARSLAEGPSIAFRYIKDNLDEAMEIAYPTAIDREAERMLRAQGTEDHREAVRAFVEKRKPTFHGK